MRIAMVCLALFVSCLAVSAAQDDAAKKDLAALQGKWQQESGLSGGKPLPADDVNKTFITFAGAEFMRSYGEKSETAKVKLDPSKKPKEINLASTRGDKSTVVEGIYEINGDTLKICITKPGQARPTEFASPEGSSSLYAVFKRVKK